MASGTIEHTDNVLVRITSDDGVSGWGEGVEAPAVTGDTQADVLAGIEMVRPHLLGLDPMERSDIWRLMRDMGCSTTTVAAIDIALHDLCGKALGVPAHELLGGRRRRRIPALTLLGSGDPDADIAEMERRLSLGFTQFKFKLALGVPDAEVETLRRAAATVGDNGMVCGDANGGWTEEVAAMVLDQLAGSGVAFIEQPVSPNPPDAMARLAASSPVPLCADESAGGLDDLVLLAAAGMGGVSLKLIKHGGMTGVMCGAVICEQLGLAINLAGKVAETAVAAGANLHCAAAIGRTAYGCSPANQGLVGDITAHPPSAPDGWFDVPDGPGLGIEVDDALVDRLRC
jgi:L-alanine-DL-glutamate epimerase-like enolase superfamily enzyme